MTDDSKPYKVICVSMYHRDIEDLKAKVDELKRLGWTKANRSHLIRLALAMLDESDIASIAETHGRSQ